MTTLYHGSHENTAPVIKIGFAAFLPADNVFDGIFANGDKNVARSHGDFIYAYEVDSIATNDDLDCDEAIQIIAKELYIDEETAAPIAQKRWRMKKAWRNLKSISCHALNGC